MSRDNILDRPKSRREVLNGMALMALGSTAAALLGSNGALAQGTDPVRGGVLTYNMNGDPPNFDMLANTTSYVIGAVGPCYNGLVCYDPLSPDDIIGELAESWDLSDDGLAYTFHLLQNVKFHDGTPMTSADVKYTFDIMRAPPEGHTSARASTLAAIDAIDIVDDYTVTFRLKQPSPSLLANLAVGWMVVLPKHVLEQGPMKDVVVGTGPFKLREYIRGTSVELERNPDYHIPERPYLDGIKIYVIPDLGTVMANFRTEQIHVFDFMPADLASQATAELASTHNVQTAINSDCFVIHFNTTVKPWDDIRVRKAVALAIDRQAVIDTLTRGTGIQTGWTLPGFWRLPDDQLQAIPGYAPVRTDEALAEAKQLLADAGYPDGFETTLLTRRIGRLEPWGILVQDQLSKIGIKATLDLQETAVFNVTMEERQFAINAGTAAVVINDPDATFGDKVPCDAVLNFAQLCDVEVDRLYELQSTTIDPEERRKLVNELEVRALSNYGSYVVAYANRYQGQVNRVHDYVLHNNPDNNKRLQNVWLS